MDSFHRMKPGQIAMQASLCTQEEEEIFRQKLLADKPEHRIGFAFISGTPRWLAVAMYGEAQVYQRITQEIMGLSLHRYSPA